MPTRLILVRILLLSVLYSDLGCATHCRYRSNSSAMPQGCLVNPPLILPVAGGMLVGGEGACPAGIALCLDLAAANSLRRREENLIRYAADAWARCSYAPIAAPQPLKLDE